MENSKVVAKVLYNMYQDRFWCPMDEMKMHKLMYFAQRESLMYDKEPLFEESFYGWKYGPVLKSVRSQFMTHSHMLMFVRTCLQRQKTIIRGIRTLWYCFFMET